eukprot:8829951-Alexandrium_andersonii.AAC.1
MHESCTHPLSAAVDCEGSRSSEEEPASSKQEARLARPLCRPPKLLRIACTVVHRTARPNANSFLRAATRVRFYAGSEREFISCRKKFIRSSSNVHQKFIR